MDWPFERGRSYHRRTDIHGRFGGQQQGGISTPARFPLVIIITGDSGSQHGYADRRRPDGVFEYFGEGQLGDMQMRAGNAAIANHAADGKSILMFQAQGKGRVRYEGEWLCEGFHIEPAPDRTGTIRDAIVFELRPLEAVVAVVEQPSAPEAQVNFAELRRRAHVAAGQSQVTGTARRTLYQRSADVRDYVLARAGEDCEGCDRPAPFRRASGMPYLEPHHIRRVSDGGPDDPAFVIALCPNCHRRVHVGADGRDYNAKLEERMSAIERDAEKRAAKKIGA